MNNKLNPLIALLVGLFFVALLVVKYWAHGEELKIRGADQMKHDTQGNIYVHFSHNLYKFNPQGKFVTEINLIEIGVYDLVGDFAFFKNGDLLIRRGRYEPSFPESVLSYMRIRDLDAPKTKQINEGLARCKLDTNKCQPFGNDGFDLDGAFHVDIDWETDEVYFSDTSRHQIFKFDQYGNQLAKQDQGFFFPNKITLHEDALWIADTNHHAIQRTDLSNDDFGSIIASYRTKNPEHQKKDWTYSFARIGENWWVNVMGINMSLGDILIFDKRWKYQKHLELPEDSDPMNISYHAGKVWVTDLKHDQIYYFDIEGEPLDIAMPEVFLGIAKQNQRSRHYYELIAEWTMYVFVLVFAIGVGLGLLQNQKSQDMAQGSMSLNWNDPNIVWISKNKKKVRQMYLLIGLLALLITFTLFSTVGVLPTTSLSGLLVFSIIIIGLIAYITYRKLSVGIGRLGDVLVLRNSSGKYAAGKGEQIVYSDMHILIDEVFIKLNLQNSIFNTQEIIIEIGPLLKHAYHAEQSEMQRILLKRQNLMVIILFAIGFIGMTAWVLLK